MTQISVKDLAVGSTKPVEIDGKRLLVCRVESGFYVVDDICTHDGGKLHGGCLDGNEIECPRHGARFDVTTGEVRALPAPVPIKSYPVTVKDGVLSIELE